MFKSIKRKKISLSIKSLNTLKKEIKKSTMKFQSKKINEMIQNHDFLTNLRYHQRKHDKFIQNIINIMNKNLFKSEKRKEKSFCY